MTCINHMANILGYVVRGQKQNYIWPCILYLFVHSDIQLSLLGGVILPLLGCIPDCAIIVVSGLGEKSKAQEKLSVGMGYVT